MRAPMWRFVLHIMLLAFAIQRGAAATILHLSGAPGLVVISAIAGAVAGVVASITVLSGRWVSGALIGLASVLVLFALAQCAILGPAIGFPALIQSLFGAVAALVLRYFIEHAQRDPG